MLIAHLVGPMSGFPEVPFSLADVLSSCNQAPPHHHFLHPHARAETFLDMLLSLKPGDLEQLRVLVS